MMTLTGITGLATEPPAQASDDPAVCDHRGFMHIERHGGKAADDEWHRRHGQPVTCAEDKRQKDEPDDTDPKEPSHLPGEDGAHHDKRESHDDVGTPLYRDHEGYSCYRLHCG